MKLRERVIDLSARIAALRDEIDEKRTELAGMERELDALLNQRTDAAPAPPTPATPPTVHKAQTVVPTGPAMDGQQVDANTIGDEIQSRLESDYDGEYQAEDFEEYAKERGVSMASIRTALARMANEEIIVRTRRGYYQAKTQP
jgi:hypothetical protein